MNARRSLSVVFAVAAALSGVAAAQEFMPIVPSGGNAFAEDVTPGLSGPGHSSGYGSRAVGPVYQASATTPLAMGNYSLYMMEDVSFVPGPWATPQTRNVSQIQWQFQCVGWTGTAPVMASFDCVFEFWNSGTFTA